MVTESDTDENMAKRGHDNSLPKLHKYVLNVQDSTVYNQCGQNVCLHENLNYFLIQSPGVKLLVT